MRWLLCVLGIHHWHYRIDRFEELLLIQRECQCGWGHWWSDKRQVWASKYEVVHE